MHRIFLGDGFGLGQRGGSNSHHTIAVPASLVIAAGRIYREFLRRPFRQRMRFPLGPKAEEGDLKVAGQEDI